MDANSQSHAQSPTHSAPPDLRVALFITCLNDQFYPSVGLAITRILQHFGCEILFPAAQTCCGQPFFTAGHTGQARALARRFIEIFEPYDYIVTPSASCAAMVRKHYPQLLAGDYAWERGAQRIAWRTFEFVEFLDDVLKVDLTPFSLPRPTTVTYHYTCRLRDLGQTDQTIRLLKQLGNVCYIPLEKMDQCCGFGGNFGTSFPELSAALAKDKATCIAQTSAETAIVNDAGCNLNITGTAHRQNIPIRTVHIAELIAEAMAL